MGLHLWTGPITAGIGNRIINLYLYYPYEQLSLIIASAGPRYHIWDTIHDLKFTGLIKTRLLLASWNL